MKCKAGVVAAFNSTGLECVGKCVDRCMSKDAHRDVRADLLPARENCIAPLLRGRVTRNRHKILMGNR